ncbi:MAG TPA: hypothetical protein VFC79_00665 [Tissierellaceae bacterium]|nr:hypothetical protein [Tissierellaceae bacterium]
MIYVFEGGSVVYDASTISETAKTRAVAVESLPDPEERDGKIPILKANKNEERVYYEYIDKPNEPEIEQLKQVVADLTELILLGGGI